MEITSTTPTRKSSIASGSTPIVYVAIVARFDTPTILLLKFDEIAFSSSNLVVIISHNFRVRRKINTGRLSNCN
uniref:Uncharacterized protein n=1 Tax=Meloidogyne incognita TaxID=6306 RepID=A0A914N3U8_MELIC